VDLGKAQTVTSENVREALTSIDGHNIHMNMWSDKRLYSAKVYSVTAGDIDTTLCTTVEESRLFREDASKALLHKVKSNDRKVKKTKSRTFRSSRTYYYIRKKSDMNNCKVYESKKYLDS
jgi:hypothetical protein